MKYVFLTVAYLISLYAIAQNNDLLEIRKMYYEASGSSRVANELQRRLENISVENNPVLFGYKGMSKLMVCYHSYNPYTKLSYFVKGKEMLEKAISAQPGNAELVYLRFSVQTNAPVFLSYYSNIKDDKEVLLAFLKANSGGDSDLFERIKKYLLESSHCSESEKIAIKELR
jgi:hypothetical protein